MATASAAGPLAETAAAGIACTCAAVRSCRARRLPRARLQCQQVAGRAATREGGEIQGLVALLFLKVLIGLAPEKLDLQHKLELARIRPLLWHHEGRRHACRSRPPRAPDAVHEVLRCVGQVVVHHVCDVLHVDAPRRHVSGYQHAMLAAGKALQRRRALRLRPVAVDHVHVMPQPLQPLGNAVRAVLGPGEDQERALLFLQHLVQQAQLLVLHHREGAQLHLLARLGGLPDLHPHRIAHIVAHNLAHVGIQRGRVAHRLPAARQRAHDAPDRRKKAHVQHPVDLVQHQHLHRADRDRAPAQIVFQPPRRRDHEPRTARQLVQLRVLRKAAAHQHRIVLRAGSIVGRKLPAPASPARAWAAGSARESGRGCPSPEGPDCGPCSRSWESGSSASCPCRSGRPSQLQDVRPFERRGTALATCTGVGVWKPGRAQPGPFQRVRDVEVVEVGRSSGTGRRVTGSIPISDASTEALFGNSSALHVLDGLWTPRGVAGRP